MPNRHVSFVDCFGVDTEVMLVDGTSRRVDQLVVGDTLLGPDGTPRTLTGNLVKGQKELYKIEYLNGKSSGFVCTGGHLLVLRIDTPVDVPVVVDNRYMVRVLAGDSNGIRSVGYYFNSREEANQFYEQCDQSPVVFEITVESFLAAPSSLQKKARLFYNEAMEFVRATPSLAIGVATEEEVGWLIGMWLGNGDAKEVKIACNSNESEVIAKVSDITTKMGLTAVIKANKTRNAVWIRLSTQSGAAKESTKASNENSCNPFYQLLQQLGLLGNKHIPEALRFQERTVREAIIAGFVDSDGTYSKGQFEVEQSKDMNANLFSEFVWLLRSCGFVAHVSEKVKSKDNTCVQFNGEASRLPIASPKKQSSDLQCAWATSQPFNVQSIGVGDFVGFETDGDQRILLKDFIVSHNCPGHDILMATMLNGAAVMVRRLTVLITIHNNFQVLLPLKSRFGDLIIWLFRMLRCYWSLVMNLAHSLKLQNTWLLLIL